MAVDEDSGLRFGCVSRGGGGSEVVHDVAREEVRLHEDQPETKNKPYDRRKKGKRSVRRDSKFGMVAVRRSPV